jgi:hypothetical protein
MAAPKKNVAFAEQAVTVHVKIASESSQLPDGSEAWDIESKVLEPGETVPFSDLPPYLSEAIRDGSAPGLTAITATQAKNVAQFKAANLEAAQALIAEEEEQVSDPNFPAEEY